MDFNYIYAQANLIFTRFSFSLELLKKKKCNLALKQNNLNYVVLVICNALALHGNAAFMSNTLEESKGHTVSTVHGPALDRDATVTQPFVESITPTRSKEASLINMSLYRFSTINQIFT